MEIQKIKNQIANDQEFRKGIAERDLLMFATIYFSEFLTYPFAPFHRGIANDLLNPEEKRLLIVAFRESAKSVIAALFFPLWCICYKKYHFILFLSDEINSTTRVIQELIIQMQENELLKQDFGELHYEEISRKKTKKKTSLDFVTTNDIQIIGKSLGKKVRQLRYKQHRPDLIIIDDIESILNTKTSARRDEIDLWMKSEVLSGSNQITGKVVWLSNLLHTDSVANRIIKENLT